MNPSFVRCSGPRRSRIGSPDGRNRVPEYAAEMNPLDQFGCPLIGPPRLSISTTYPGRFWFTVPRPYTAQLPSDGRLKYLRQYPQGELYAAVTGYLPAFLVGSVLLFALVLHLFYRRRRRGYVEHAVFALHWSAFYLLLMMVERLLPAGGASPRLPSLLIFTTGAVYLAVALRRVYGQSWFLTVVKTLCLYLTYQALLTLWMLSAIVLAFRLLL